MASRASLSESDLDLLVEMFCCVIAADRKVSGRELSVATDALTSLGHSPDANVLKTKVVDYCKSIHKKGVDAYVADLLQRVKRLAAPALAAAFIEAQPTLLYADGASTPDEERVSQQIVACLTNIMASLENDPLPYVRPGDSTSSLGSSVLGTAKSSAALAAATAERTKLITVSLPAAFVKLGRHCMTSKAFTADFPQLYASIAKLTAEMKTTAEKLASASSASTLAGKAHEIASKGMTLALSQKQNVQYQRLMHDLGKAAYEAKGLASGPQELCAPIRHSKERIDQLEALSTVSANDLKEVASGVGRKAVGAANSVRRAGFLQSPLVIALASIAFAPIGLFLIWLHPTWRRGTKTLWAAGAVACFCGLAYIGMLQVEGTRKAIAQADEMWAAGERDKAAVQYRQCVDVISRLPKTEQASTLGRLIEYEHRNGDSAATQALVSQVIQRRIVITSECRQAQVLVEKYQQKIQADKDAAEEEGRLRKQQAAAAKQQAAAAKQQAAAAKQQAAAAKAQESSVSSGNDEPSPAGSDRTYKLTRGLLGGSTTVVTGGDVGLNLELSGLKWDGPKIKMRVKWIRGDRPPWRYNVTAYNAKEEVVQTTFLSCPLVIEGRQGETFIGEIYLGSDAARTAKEIRIHM